MGITDFFSDLLGSVSFVQEVHAEAPADDKEDSDESKDEEGGDDKAEGDEDGGEEAGDSEEGGEEGGDDEEEEEEEEEEEPVDPKPILEEGSLHPAVPLTTRLWLEGFWSDIG
jgi:ubiquinol-cytochrome c reductase subunit 6